MNTLTLKTGANTLSMLICFGICGCSTTNRDWEAANRSATIAAYEQFLERHPNARQGGDARQKVAQLHADDDWGKASSSPSIPAYQQYLAKYPSSRHSSQAREQLERLEAERDWHAAQAANTINVYAEFMSKHPASKYTGDAKRALEEMEAERDWQGAKGANTLDAYRSFVSKHPNSKYAEEANAKRQDLETERDWRVAETTSTEDTWIVFIKQHSERKEAAEAIANLKTHTVHTRGLVIPWSAIPSVRDSRELIGEGVTCGVKMNAFDPFPKLGYSAPHVSIGGTRFFKPGTASLGFEKWTTFDGYSVKGNASVELGGLSFAPAGSVVIAPNK